MTDCSTPLAVRLSRTLSARAAERGAPEAYLPASAIQRVLERLAGPVEEVVLQVSTAFPPQVQAIHLDAIERVLARFDPGGPAAPTLSVEARQALRRQEVQRILAEHPTLSVAALQRELLALGHSACAATLRRDVRGVRGEAKVDQ